MSNQSIPIKISSVPVPVTIRAADMNQLLEIIAEYLTGEISQDVTFILEVSSNPTQYSGDLIYNTSSRMFFGWDTGTGSYLPVSQWNPGDSKQTFVAGDELSLGWVQLDGRLITTISGISANQQSVLFQLFGINSSLPTVLPIQSLVGLPAAGTFAAQVPPATQPPSGQIGALPFDGDYNPQQPQALAQNTETLRGSASGVQGNVAAIANLMEAVLAALTGTGSGPRLYAKVYCGPP